MSTFEHLLLVESIIEASPAIIFRWIIQESWPVEYVSKNIEQLGYTQEEMISGKISWPGITHPDDVPRLEKEVKDFLADGKDRWSQTYRLRAHDGSYRWMRDWNLLLRDDQGVPRKIQGIVMDITKEKSAEQQREDAQKELEKALAKVISGFLPICAQCKAIRDSAGNWIPIENYIFTRAPCNSHTDSVPNAQRSILETYNGKPNHPLKFLELIQNSKPDKYPENSSEIRFFYMVFSSLIFIEDEYLGIVRGGRVQASGDEREDYQAETIGCEVKEIAEPSGNKELVNLIRSGVKHPERDGLPERPK